MRCNCLCTVSSINFHNPYFYIYKLVLSLNKSDSMDTDSNVVDNVIDGFCTII